MEPGQQMSKRSSQSSGAEPPAAQESGDQQGVEQHLGVWSSAASAVV